MHCISMQTPLLEPETPFTFEWKRAAKMPFKMTEYPQAVVMNGKVYIGGRVAFTSSSSSLFITAASGQTVMVYEYQLDRWSTIPPYECEYFAMAAVNNRLVLIGGCDVAEDAVTAQLGVWDGKWTKPFTPMPTARCSVSAITYIKWLVVIGGRLEDVDTKLSNVEILDTTLDQWYRCAPLPQPCSSISLTATVGNMCYALGGFTSNHRGSTKAFSVCLDNLISQAVSQSAYSSIATPSPWQALPNTPLAYSTAISVDGALFAVGGLIQDSMEPSTSVYLYQPSCKSWVLAEVLPHGRERCACIAFADRKILIAGRGVGYGSQEVDIAEVKYHHAS